LQKEKQLDPDKTPVVQVMTENPKTITFDQTACDALQLMQTHGFRHLLIIDD